MQEEIYDNAYQIALINCGGDNDKAEDMLRLGMMDYYNRLVQKKKYNEMMEKEMKSLQSKNK